MAGSLIIIEPFYGGSHKGLIDLLYNEFKDTVKHVELYTLPAKKWHWKARTSALYFSQNIPSSCKSEGVLFVSSVLNLSELVGLRPDLGKMHKIIYFHENDLIYPVRNKKERDFQFGYNQVLSCLVADCVVFNSNYNKSSFLNNIKSFFKIMSDHRPQNLREKIEHKCQVLYYPLELDYISSLTNAIDKNTNSPLHILWPHRWEHDKNPELFFKVLYSLKEQGFLFTVSVLGENFSQIPAAFDEAKQLLSENISNWGYVNSKKDYYKVLSSCDVVISTSNHEFFGVAMLEAVYLGCYPLCPNSLVYPEIFPKLYLYNTPIQLEKRLKQFCKNPNVPRKHINQVEFQKYDWNVLKSEYRKLMSLVK